ncbi:MAG: hypothetical protein U5L09_07845 [Bacteroidales bacterium]|nr:hypothetical protein [Bacteroidales bacterium]
MRFENVDHKRQFVKTALNNGLAAAKRQAPPETIIVHNINGKLLSDPFDSYAPEYTKQFLENRNPQDHIIFLKPIQGTIQPDKIK